MQLAAQTNTQLLHLKVPPAGRSGRKSEDIWFHTLNTLSTQHSTKASFFAQSHLLKRLILCNFLAMFIFDISNTSNHEIMFYFGLNMSIFGWQIIFAVHMGHSTMHFFTAF